MRMTWVASVVATALLAVMLLSVGGTAAKTPGWGFSPVVANPDPVGPGNLVEYSFTISNTGTGSRSNISALYLATDIPLASGLATPAWIELVHFNGQPTPADPCGTNPPSGALNCSLGALNYGNSIDFKIIFRVPSTSGTYAFNFLATGNGNTPSDSGGTSHGDTLKGPASVGVSGSDEFDGGFTLGTGGTFDTGGTLGKNNPQQSTVVTTQSFYAATIQDGVTPSTNPCTSTCIGQWTKVTAPNPDGGLIKVELLVYGKGIPGSVTADEIFVYHVGATGDEAIIGDQSFERCTTADPCATANSTIFVQADGQNFRITLWLLHNGSLRGSW